MRKIVTRVVSNHQDVIFVKADKGDLTVKAKRDDYYKTDENILESDILYGNIKTSMVLATKNKFNNIAIRWQKKRLMINLHIV